MTTEWLYWILIFLFFAGSLFLLYIPLPADISDRSKLAVAEFLLRLSNEYLGDLFEKLFGAEIRNRLTRVIIAIGFILPHSPPKGITRKLCKIAGVDCITYDLQDDKKSDAIMVFIHGGGWCTGDPRYYDDIIYQLISKIGICAVSIGYRLAPEYPFPQPLDDCEAVVRELYLNGCDHLKFDKNKIIVKGDSAGGNLTAALCQRLVKKQDNFIKAQVLIYPVIHTFNFNSPSYQEYWRKYPGTALLNPRHMARWILLYLGIEASRDNIKKLMNSQHLDSDFENSPEYQKLIGQDVLPEEFKIGHINRKRKPVDQELADKFLKVATNPEVSPIFGVTSGIPPTLVLTSGYDVLRDEGIQYVKRLQQMGIKTSWKHFPRAFHGLFNMPNSDDRLEMMQEVVDFTKNLL